MSRHASSICSGLPPGSEQHAVFLRIGEDGHVVVATATAGLVDADGLDVGEVSSLASFLDVVLQNPPHPRVVLADQVAGLEGRHSALHQEHDVRLHQQREPGTRSCPRQRGRFHSVLGTLHPRLPSM